MESNSSKGWNGYFYFDWSAFDTLAGVKYTLGVVIIYLLGSWLNFPWFTAGVCALLAWLSDVPGPRYERISGMIAFAILCVLLTALFHVIGEILWLHISAIFMVTFAGTMLLLRGPRAFMIGWCAIYWFLLVPLFTDLNTGPSEVITSILIGVGVVVFLVLLGGVFAASEPEKVSSTSTSEGPPDTGFVLGYSGTLGIVMALGLWIGSNTLTTDPTLVANAAFMVIGMSSRQTWIAGIERSTGAILGIFVGFYLFQYLDNEIMLFLVGVVLSFLCMALMNVNPAAFIFFFLIYISHSWVAQGFEQANIIANERILAELLGVAIAAVSVFFLTWFNARRPPTVPNL